MAYTTIDDPSAHFQTVLYTGNEAARTITNDGNSDLQPDFIWNKGRDHAHYHYLTDTTRGLTKYQYSNATNAEETFTTYVTNTTSDGFTLGNGQGMNDNTNVGGGVDYVTWQWKANGGTRTTVTESGANPGGGHQSDTTAGFSIVDYVGTGGAGHVTHGLGAVPEWIVFKNRDETESWLIYHVAIGNGKGLRLDTTAAADTTANHWANTTPNSSTIVVGGNPPNNKDAINYIAYCFASVQGYSKFGSYIGNGNVDGAFVYTGFKPAFVIQKQTSAGGEYWMMKDSKREPFNQNDANIYPNATNVEGDTNGIDLLSNGFKCRTTGAGSNADGATYIYIAFAKSPFVSSTGIPTTAA